MKKKVIWIVNNYAGTPERGMQFRQYYLASALRQLGYEAFVISSSYHHLLTNFPENGVADEKGVPFLWIRNTKYHGNGVGRIVNMIIFSTLYPVEGMKKLPPPDVIITSSPHLFVLPPALILSHVMRTKPRVIFEVRDIWPLSLTELMNTSRWNPLVVTFSIIEKAGYKYSDAVVSLIPGAIEHMKKKGLKEEQFNYIPNGLPEEVIKKYEKPSREILSDEDRKTLEKIESMTAGCSFKFVFTGTVGLGTGIESLLEGFATFSSKINSACFIVVGDGALFESLRKKYSHPSYPVFFTGRVKPSLVPHILKMSDVACAGWPNKKIYELGGSPNKLFDYMAASLPILFVAPVKEEYNIVARAGAGITIQDYDKPRIAEGFEKLFKMDPDERKKMGHNGHKYLLQNFTYREIGKQYSKLIEKLLD